MDEITGTLIEKYKHEAYNLGRADEQKAMIEVIRNHYIDKNKVRELLNKVDKMISEVEMNISYGRYKRYGGKIKANNYLAQLYGHRKAFKLVLEVEQ